MLFCTLTFYFLRTYKSHVWMLLSDKSSKIAVQKRKKSRKNVKLKNTQKVQGLKWTFNSVNYPLKFFLTRNNRFAFAY